MEEERKILIEKAKTMENLQSQLSSEREIWKAHEAEMKAEIASLEQSVEKQNEDRIKLELELTEVKSREKCLVEFRIASEEEIEKLRKRIQELEIELQNVKSQLAKVLEQLANEKERFRLAMIEREQEEMEQLELKEQVRLFSTSTHVLFYSPLCI
jgi:chromosome segregation protein